VLGPLSAPYEVCAVPEPARWYHLQGEEQHGPIDLEAMRELVMAGTVTPDTFVWADGMPDWLHAREVPALTPPEGLRARLPAWH
jgi:hypothetical protein